MANRFLKNKQWNEKSLTPDNEETRKLNIHDFSPYCEDFDGEVRKLFAGGTGEINPNVLTFFNHLIGRGGFANIYLSLDKNGRKYASKLFYPYFMVPSREKNKHHGLVNLVRDNISSNSDVLKQDFFNRTRLISGSNNESVPLGYVTDFFDGEEGNSLLGKMTKQQDVVGNVFLTYSKMLSYLHQNGLVFVDNNLGSILFNGENVKICDSDFISDGIFPISVPYHPHYISREQVLDRDHTPSADLEGLALMVHHVIFNQPFLDYSETSEEIKDSAEKNIRVYGKSFRKGLPKNLRQIVPALIDYPRDDSITASDFSSAVKEDFHL